jgi:hypothetical protein
MLRLKQARDECHGIITVVLFWLETGDLTRQELRALQMLKL